MIVDLKIKLGKDVMKFSINWISISSNEII